MNKIHSMDKVSVFAELKRLVHASLPIKGTYIKTLEPDDIFDTPVNKTSELQSVKVGNTSILVPIVKEPEVAEGAIPVDMLSKVVSKIKDPRSRKILAEYLEQEKAQAEARDVASKTVVKMEEAEGKNEDYQEVITRKKELVEKIKAAADETELASIIKDSNVNEFKKELGEAGLKYALAGLTKAINTTKKKLETNRLVAQARAQQVLQQPPAQPPGRPRKQQPPAPNPQPPAPNPNPPVQPPVPPVQPPAPNPQPPAPNSPAQGASAFASSHTELFQRLDATLAKKSKTKLKTIKDLDAFLVANGYDDLYANGTQATKSALSKARNKFINTHGLK
jgi:hypothetical protein